MNKTLPDHNLPRPAGIVDTGYNENTSPYMTRGLMRSYVRDLALEQSAHIGTFAPEWDGEVYTPMLFFRPPMALTEGTG